MDTGSPHSSLLSSPERVGWLTVRGWGVDTSSRLQARSFCRGGKGLVPCEGWVGSVHSFLSIASPAVQEKIT